MNSYALLPNNYYHRFTGYHIKSHIINNGKKAIATGKNEQYKLHLNLSDKDFVAHRDTIVASIMKHGLNNGIIGFKYYNYDENSIKRDTEVTDHFHYMEALRLSHLSLQHPDGSTESEKYLQQANLHLDSITNNDLKTRLQNAVNNPKFEEYYPDHYANTVSGYRSHFRFINQAQFTIYLEEPINAEKVANFCKLFLDDLAKAGINQGQIANTDLMLAPPSRLLTFRQAAFNSNPFVYVEGTHDDPAMEAKIAEQLQNEARESVLYKHLVTAVKQPVTAADAKAKSVTSKSSSNKLTTFTTTAAGAAAGGATAAALGTASADAKSKNIKPH